MCHYFMEYAIYLGVHRFTPVLGLQGELGWLSSKTRRKLNMIRYWNRLIQMDNSRLTKRIFLWDYRLNSNNWSSEISQILDEYSLLGEFENQNFINRDILQKRALEVEEQAWRSKCENSPKLRTYITFKEKLVKENYIACNLSRLERSYLAQIRLGILPLNIEVGRFKGIKLEDRICELCADNKIENENHFLFDCKAYSYLRNIFFDNIAARQQSTELRLLPDHEKSFILYQGHCRQTSKFIKAAYKKRRNILYTS